ncbi:uncharacterized protein LOC1277892 isoform X1 [Anopheles gambiae]|uniref:uncharacterized protein LOC1277892 isoform X1 n=1 Tax=Anopheles gambiae TaxID=7165 RepID=UPI002AC987DF|nr:uncharacterized protein LOC1277892 isoform X1 [Anopheles gambiae]XP_061514477.1 uncharacterized protein LOC1277892 isoform X1 [Anopheles gambiae]XP_061514478.1 uncharacterized protein LOC1277892 isoform X1 [Anopheles gambiae]XP_061514479.1 uncharacterized protein LOC1277892 isoform X1 [Anopheles gambiae]XP_061514480.1 uncharacterized protein LOC1277892 isoform X1 [Anopheles gambiae]XP_061514481.1 uncharacterized protein LOC1277892 isoform X1 [Anopheles gambiae]XP_061514482.1 uncharacterize
MRKVWLLASVVLAFLDFVKSQEVARTLYSTRYDNLDIDTILASNRLVTNYVDCLLSRKPCPPEGKDLKRILPEALRTKCARCSPIQKENALKIITRLYYDYPDQYRALRERWDPSGEYHRRFEEYLRGLQFNQIGGSNGGSGVGNTVVSGGNDRPVRNDLDRQPATQSSNVQAIVIDPTLAGQPIGNVNTLPPSPPTPPAAAAVAPAVTERPRPPAPIAQELPRPEFAITTTVGQSLQPGATTPFTGTVRPDEVSAVPLWLGAQLAQQQILPARPADESFADGGAGIQNLGTAGTGYQLPLASMYGGTVPTTTAGRVEPRPTSADNNGLDELPTAPPPVVVNRFGDDEANGRPSVAPAVPVVPTTTTTTARPTTTVRQTRPATRQTTTRNTQRTTTRFITRLPPTPPPTPPRTTTTTTTRTPTILPQRPPPPPPLFAPQPAPAQQQPILPQATPPQQQYPSVVYQRPQAPPRASPPPPPVPQAPLPTSAPARPFYVQTEPPRTPPPPQQQYPTVVYQRPQAPSRASPPPPPLPTSAPARPYYVQTEPPRTPPPPLPPVQQQYPTVVYQRPQAPPPSQQAPARPFYVQPEPPATQYGQTTPDSIIDHFFVPPSSQAANQPLPPSPIVGLWNQLGTKIADTADAIAGMLKKTVDVLVTSHIQSHQRALRRIQ